MPTLYHPTIPDVSYEVDENVDAWVEQGWLETSPKPVEPQGEPPRAGAGSGKQAWVDYATGLGFEVGDATREAIIAMVDAGPARPTPDSVAPPAEPVEPTE